MDEAEIRPGVPVRNPTDAEISKLIRQERAEEAIRAVGRGVNPAEAVFALANDYTDELTGFGRRLIRGWFRRPSE